ncbi:hypothetical protein JCM8547_003652 [Rhodosporidiobolus lusitaniae]
MDDVERVYLSRLRAARARRRKAVFLAQREEEERSRGTSSDGCDEEDGEKEELIEKSLPASSPSTTPSYTPVIVLLLIIAALAVGGGVYYLFFRTDGASTTASTGIDSSKTSSAEPDFSSPSQKITNSASTLFSSLSHATNSPSTTTSSSVSPTSSSSMSGELDQSTLVSLGISTFLGNNTGGIASWYRTDSGTDSTNGRSWCEFPYDDTVPGFAPSVGTMLSSFNDDEAKAKEAFCGLEANVYSPKTGQTVTLYIADGFDDTWVLTPASIDVIYGSFELVYGSSTNDKNNVAKDVSWVLTGGRDDRFTYKGVGVG